MNQRSSDGANSDNLKVFAGMLIVYIVLQMLNRGNGTGDDEPFSYSALTSAVDAAIGTEGFSANDILGDGTTGDETVNGECISHNVIGEFTGELTEEEATCITYTNKKACVEPCLWYTRDRVRAANDNLADIDDGSTTTIVCARAPVDGVCASGFELNEHGCCTLPLSEMPSIGDSILGVGYEIAKGEAAGLIVALSPAVLKFLAGEGLTPGGIRAMNRAFKAMKMARAGAAVIARLTNRLAARIGAKFGSARVLKVGSKLGAK